MKIKMLKSCVGFNFSYAKGQEIDVDEALAKDFIQAKYAESIKTRPKIKHKTEE